MTKEEYLKELDKAFGDYTVYMHRNKINGKVYIGITKRKPQYRWNNGKGYDNQYFKRAIKKYGFDNFEHIILCEKLTQKEAEQKEIEFIAYYKSSQKDFGYNISKGGMVNNGVPCKEETKQKISQANKGTNNGMYGKHHTDKEKGKISEASKRLWQNKQHREKMLEVFKTNRHNFEKGHIPWNKGKKGIIPWNRKKVICIDTNEIFNSIAEAEKIKKVHNISLCCNGKRKSAKGLHFKFYEE